MLSALRSEDHQQVILLREDGLALAEELRAQARENRILCEVCAQPVVVHAGTERTWHFAHRTLAHCPKAQESMELVEARALLYGWLRVRFPDAVQLEKILPGLPRPVDCWVDRPGKPPLAWWLVTAGLKPEVRGQLARVFAQRGALPHYVFLARLLTPDPDLHRGFILSTTERALMRPSSYGELYDGGSQSLHYLDGATRHLLTCRGLLPVHPPQGYRADLQDHPLEEVRILPRTGEFVHPGEAERLKALVEAARQEDRRQEALRAARQAERARAIQRAAQRARTIQRAAEMVVVPRLEAVEPAMPKTSALPETPASHQPSASQQTSALTQPLAPSQPTPPHQTSPLPRLAPLPCPPPPAVPPEQPSYTCRECGRQTRDWVILYGNTGQCKCRACVR